ncbi:MAG: hypothetical protein KGP28_11445 [Bdellovibrionales bacterium]|nr:hypothetical protein [Bdellovibrionales bacterium]
MMRLRLLLRLALIPFRRAWGVLGLMVVSLAQMFLALWFCALLQNEISHTRQFAEQAKLVTIQLKEQVDAMPAIGEVLEGQDVTIEEWSSEEVLSKMEQDEPELVQTVRSLGSEGGVLFPKMIIIRGVVAPERIEKLKLMTQIARLDQSPVHHSRLTGFYRHLGLEIKIAGALLLLLVLVQLVVFQRIQDRDASEVVSNLAAWGVPAILSRLPSFLSMVTLSAIAGFLAILEWVLFRAFIWKDNAFLGELSLDHGLAFPWGSVALTFFVVAVMSLILVFSGRSVEE